MMLSFDSLIQQLFYQWGSIAYRFRFLLFLGPILLTVIFGFGFLFIKKQTTIDPEYVFSPKNAQWHYEKKVLSEHWPLNEQEFWPGKSYDYSGYVDIIAAGKKHHKFGRPNMLVIKYLDELERINQYIIHNITIPVAHNNATYQVGFTDLCMSYNWKCFMNEHITMLMPKERWESFDPKFAEFADDIITKEIKITYPIGWRGTEPIYFGALVGAPHIIDHEGHFNYIRAIRLTYNVRDEKVGNVSYLWRKKVADYLSDVENPASEILEFGMFHNESLPEGLQQVADSLSPKFAITCVVLSSLCLLSAIILHKHSDGTIAIDWVRSKPSIGLAGLFCPLLAIISSFGFILWMGFLYNAIVDVSPFIIFCIGVDDMFIMSAAWHRTDPNNHPSDRLSESLADAAVAISITTITDMLTFGIGCLTTLPSVQMFCLYTFMGITFTYIYQLTFFASVMAYSGKREGDGLHAITLKPIIKPELADTLFKKLFLSGNISSKLTTANDNKISSEIAHEIANKNRQMMENVKMTLNGRIREKIMNFKHKLNKEMAKSRHPETMISKIFREYYGPFLLDSFTKKVFLFIYIIYISLAILGCSMVEEGLNPKFLVLDSFYLSKFYILMDETFWEEGLQMQVVVNSPPDLFVEKERKAFQTMLDEFENTKYTMRHNATMIWLDAYERKLQEDYDFSKIPLPKTSEEWYKRCREWLISAGGRRLWEKDMVWGTNESDSKSYNHLFAFRFQLGLRNYKTPTDHMRSAILMREISAKYAQFNVTTFHEYYPFADQSYNHLFAFRFQLGLRNYKTPTDHMRSAILMREISAKYAQFNVTTFHEYYPFADQYIELKPALIRNCLLAMLSMLIVSFIMIPSWIAAFVIAFAIFSIDIGVIGFMTFWGVRLESVSMITVIMSIGFAVDLSAHIGYAYVKADGDRQKKAISALETIGWPVFLVSSLTLTVSLNFHSRF
uniref:SSD domain-containing protein n=1 Tax=Setaria digitata TaxID=48799 RepID=A0A915PIT1_9BILA